MPDRVSAVILQDILEAMPLDQLKFFAMEHEVMQESEEDQVHPTELTSNQFLLTWAAAVNLLPDGPLLTGAEHTFLDLTGHPDLETALEELKADAEFLHWVPTEKPSCK